MAELITQTGLVLTGVLKWSGDIVTFVVAQPLLLIPVVFGFIGGAVAMVKRFKG